MKFLITGATGFVGSHLAQAVVDKGHSLSVIIRPTSDDTALKKLGAQIQRGSLDDPAVVRPALAETDVVVHCAAKVGDWGPTEDFRKANVEQLRGFLDLCKGQALSRFIHISSLTVYPTKHHYQTDETQPVGTWHHDGYSQSKAEAEEVAMRYHREYGVPVVILRPGFVYGPGERIVMPRIIQNLRDRRVRYPGAKGKRALNTIYVGNLIQAIFLAVQNERAVGEIYNLTDDEFVSKRRFIEKIADSFGLPHPHLMPPLWLVKAITWTLDKAARMRGSEKAPIINFQTLKFLGYNLDFSVEKAKRELGYKPRTSFDDAMVETLAWYKNQPS